MKIMVSMLLIILSASAFSERIVITGKPIRMEIHRNFYTLPDHYTDRRGYRFVRVLNTNRVCYLQAKPELASLDMIQVLIEEDGQKLRWDCYKFDSRFFERDF